MPLSVIASGNQQINLPHFPWQPAVQCSEAPAVATIRGRPGGGTVSPHQSCRQTQRERSAKISLPPPARRREKKDASSPSDRENSPQYTSRETEHSSLLPGGRKEGGRDLNTNLYPHIKLKNYLQILETNTLKQWNTTTHLWNTTTHLVEYHHTLSGIPPHTCGIPPHI